MKINFEDVLNRLGEIKDQLDYYDDCVVLPDEERKLMICCGHHLHDATERVKDIIDIMVWSGKGDTLDEEIQYTLSLIDEMNYELKCLKERVGV